METVTLGRSGLFVSRICLGAMSFGTPEWRDWVLDETASRPIIEKALELGINFFDTADMYSAGKSEEVLGRALRDLARREEYVVATKAYFPTGDSANERGLSRKHLMDAVEGSLKRLGMDYIDLFYLHRWNYSTPIEETLQTLHTLIQAGKIRYIGASSMYAWQFAKALYTADLHGWTRFIAMQNHYNLIYREEEREMIPLCLDQNIGLVPWSPVARGFLAGNRTQDKTGNTARAKSDDFAHKMYYADNDFAIVSRLQRMAEQKGVSPIQLGLAWVLNQKGVTSPILGTTKIKHLEEAVESLSIQLTPEEKNELQQDYKPHPILGHSTDGNDLFYRS